MNYAKSLMAKIMVADSMHVAVLFKAIFVKLFAQVRGET